MVNLMKLTCRVRHHSGLRVHFENLFLVLFRNPLRDSLCFVGPLKRPLSSQLLPVLLSPFLIMALVVGSGSLPIIPLPPLLNIPISGSVLC